MNDSIHKVENQVNVRFCDNCGAKLKAVSRSVSDKKSKKHVIFISHAEADQKIVKVFCDMLCKILPHPRYKLFCSSENGCIEFGKNNERVIHANLNCCDVMICLLTNKSCERPWVMYEIGFFLGRASKERASKKYFVPISIRIGKKKILKKGLPYSKFKICECNEEQLITLMMQLYNIIFPNYWNGNKEKFEKSNACHVQFFIDELKRMELKRRRKT